MTTDELFVRFGKGDARLGRKAVICITGAAYAATANWRHDGVPYRHWPRLIVEAERRGIPGVDFAALQGTRPTPSNNGSAAR